LKIYFNLSGALMFITSVSDFDVGMSPSSAVTVTSEPDSSGSQAHRLKVGYVQSIHCECLDLQAFTKNGVELGFSTGGIST